MRVKLKRVWQEPKTLNRYKRDNPKSEDGTYEFPKAHLAVLPSDAEIHLDNGEVVLAAEARADPKLITPAPKPKE